MSSPTPPPPPPNPCVCSSSPQTHTHTHTHLLFSLISTRKGKGAFCRSCLQYQDDPAELARACHCEFNDWC